MVEENRLTLQEATRKAWTDNRTTYERILKAQVAAMTSTEWRTERNGIIENFAEELGWDILWEGEDGGFSLADAKRVARPLIEGIKVKTR